MTISQIPTDKQLSFLLFSERFRRVATTPDNLPALAKANNIKLTVIPKASQQSAHQLLERIELKLLPFANVLKQRGNTCKLYALGNAMKFIENKYGIIAPKVRKDQTTASTSLRQQAKAKYGSQIGEMYNPNDLISLAEDFDYSAQISTASTLEEYITIIKSHIDHDRLPIVFFNVNISTGQPMVDPTLDFEHGAAITGYEIHGKKCVFTVTQWGEEYKFDANLLFASSQTLQTPRQPEIFRNNDPMHKWVNVDSANQKAILLQLAATNSLTKNIRIAAQPKSEQGGLRCKIMALDITLHLAVKHKRLDLAKQLITSGCALNKQNNQGLTALQIAINLGDSAMVGLLTAPEANVTKVPTW